MSRWKILKSQILLQTGFFRLRSDECELPDGRVMPRYYVFEFPDWVNVVAITADGNMVLVRQHRHGAEEDFLEIPGGSTHPGGKEDPRLAGERELLEETGYSAKEWIYCGFQYPNPALQTNRLHTYIALDCAKTAEPELDPFEDLQTELMEVGQVFELLRKGEIKHSLIASSLGLAMRALQERGIPPKK